LTIESAVRIVAGLFVLASLALGVDASPLFVTHRALWLTTFVGLMLLQSGFTGVCPAAYFLKKLGLRSAADPSPAP
jgi:hypothetical protein